MRSFRINRSYLPLLKFLAKLKINEQILLIALSFGVGIATGFGAIAFRWAILSCKNFFLSPQGVILSHISAYGDWLIPLVPAIGGLLVGPIVYRYAQEARGHGVPEVMEAVALKGGVIRPRVAVAKAVASAICIGSGGSAGREGPIVQIGSSIGSTVGQFFHMSGNRVKILVGCGAAAGISAVFNAPIAGVLFALEIVLGDFTIPTFGPIILSSVLASVISRAFLGNQPAFSVPSYSLVSAWEIPLYMGLGILAGFVAVLYIKALYKTEDLFEALKITDVYKPALAGLMLGIIGVFFPQIFSDGYESITSALRGEVVVWLMFLLVFLKMIATSLTLGSGNSGGIFAPSLFMGAMLGGFYGGIMHAIFPHVTASTGAYALVGMSAVVAGAIHAPITGTLLIFEMTGDYRIILPVMLASVISTFLADHLQRDSIYTLKLRRRGVSLKAGKDKSILEGMLVREVMTTTWQTVPQDMPLPQLLRFVEESRESVFPVLNRDGELKGMLTLQDIRPVVTQRVLEDLVIVEDIMMHYPPTLSPDENLGSALAKFEARDLDGLPVVDQHDPKKLLGVLRRADIISFYNKRLLEQEVLKRA
jgi:CIC family chloride channel protein